MSALWDFLRDNPSGVFTLLGVLVAGLINVAIQRAIQSKKTRVDRHDRTRQLLGDFISKVNARLVAEKTMKAREAAFDSVARNYPLIGIQAMTGKGLPADYAEAQKRWVDAKEAVRAADAEVMNIFFQLSIMLRPDESEVLFACKAVMAGHDQDDVLYSQGYKYLLAVSGQFFHGDNRSHARKAASKARKQRPDLLETWLQHNADENGIVDAAVEPQK